MGKICEGRVVIVTGAARGIGRGYALEFARQGASVVVNDLGGDVHGGGGSITPAQEVVNEITAMGGKAIVNGDDVADWAGAENLIKSAVDAFGRLDVLVNNAGILRDKLMIRMDESDWDAVIRVHMKGTFGPCHFAGKYWRECSKAGELVDARIINTTSGSGLFGNVGQSNYGAAKAGIASFSIITAMELDRYGVTVNAISPGARTRMTVGLGDSQNTQGDEVDLFSPDNVAPMVVWLGSAESAGITGRVFQAEGGTVRVQEGWSWGPVAEQGKRWDPAELGPVVRDLLDKAVEPSRSVLQTAKD
tara:strand:+ start:3522 stop:4436 length:915 start_codon:yes stop_codon:yes gene_type:complete